MGALRDLAKRPLVLLAVLAFASLAARAAWLGAPCRSPCRHANDHILVFDESYYVNAARVIAGIRPPLGATYAGAPLGDDPNSEHPQLVKLMLAGSIEWFGDGPFAWRLGSLVFGTLAILGIYALVGAAGGDRWMAVGAAALMALDNLQLVHGRIGTLDVYALTAMLWGAVLYLRRHPIAAGVVIGAGSCFKMVTPYVLLVLLLYELFGSGWRPAVRELGMRLGGCIVSAVASFLALLAVLDRIAPPYDNAAGKAVRGGVLGHVSHMFSYAANQASPGGPHGIASYPWQWLVDYKPITYLNINPARPSPGLYSVHPALHFLGVISPPILVAALPGLVLCAVRVLRRGSDAGGLERLGLAWFVGAWLPFELLSVLFGRTSYLYYMVIVMPGLYLAAICLIAGFRAHRRLVALWALAAVAAAVVMYPLTPLP